MESFCHSLNKEKHLNLSILWTEENSQKFYGIKNPINPSIIISNLFHRPMPRRKMKTTYEGNQYLMWMSLDEKLKNEKPQNESHDSTKWTQTIFHEKFSVKKSQKYRQTSRQIISETSKLIWFIY